MRLDDAICRACTIGRAHKAGRRPTHWPDGSPIERTEIKPAQER